jgi:O-succinylbenzoate synthase
LQRAERAVARGARHLKFKATGRAPEVETSRLIEVRRACDAPLRLRLDLNGSLDVAAARDALACYERAELELVEEPTHGAGLLDLGECAVPWFADESLQQADLRGALIGQSAASGVVLKPTLLGGVTRCLALASLAAQHGKRSIVTHAFEGPVALAACAELALALEEGTAEAAGLDLHGALSAFPSARVLQLPKAAVGDALRVDAAPVHGHGVTLCEELWKTS